MINGKCLFACFIYDYAVIGSSNLSYGLASIVISLVIVYFILVLYEVVVTIIRGIQFEDVFLPMKTKLIKLLEISVFVLSLIYSISVLVYGGDQCPQKWQWHFGLLSIICGWTYLILLSYKLPSIGVYASTFTTIVYTFVKLGFFAILLILASTIILRMVFYDPTALVSQWFLV